MELRVSPQLRASVSDVQQGEGGALMLAHGKVGYVQSVLGRKTHRSGKNRLSPGKTLEKQQSAAP